ncbi:hypothetical protein A3K63_00770 [Candidatus Micrarchaeota archaeon RBG_16_49_10]|nr:MAG: hypothetical protein A3K63_00770 [Candidatus Micrarchaeota archaeon RBG_16_49_10]
MRRVWRGLILILLLSLIGLRFATSLDPSGPGSRSQTNTKSDLLNNVPVWLKALTIFIMGPNIALALTNYANMVLPPILASIVNLLLIVLIPGSVFFIVYGFLNELKIFRSTQITNVWLALTVALVMIVPLPVAWLGPLAQPIMPLLQGTTVLCAYTLLFLYFYGMGWASLLAFGLIFTFGLYYFFLKKKLQWSTTAGVYSAFHDETKNLRLELAEMSEAVAEAAHKLATEKDPNKRVALEASLRELQDRRRDVQERLTELHESTRNM